MKHTLKAAFAVSALLVAMQASAQTKITFDAGDPIGGLAAGATLSNQYAAFGVTFSPNAFSGAGGPTGDWASNTDMTVVSSAADAVGVLGGPNLVSGNVLHSFDGWLDEDGDPSFRATFAAGVTSFSADFAGVSIPADVHLFAYNGTTLLGNITSGVTTGQFTLSFAAATITSVVITPGTYNDWAAVDNITFTPKAVAAIPEPETYALMGLGLAAVAFARRRAVKTRA